MRASHRARAGIAAALVMAVAGVGILGSGGRASTFLADTETAFREGDAKGVVVTSSGELRLSRSMTAWTVEDAESSAVFCMAQAKDGTVFLGTGPEGRILAVRGGKSELFATIEDAPVIASMTVDAAGKLLVGVGGSSAKVYRFDPADKSAKPQTVLDDADSHYVWSLVNGPDGTVYAGTGPVGKVFALTPDGKSSEVYSVKEGNILSMAAGKDGTLYLGTDPEGLVLKLDLKSGKASVLLDAAETEITALALDAAGNLYAATGTPSPNAADAHEGSGTDTNPGTPGMDAGPGGADGKEPPALPEPPNQPPAPAPREPETPKEGLGVGPARGVRLLSAEPLDVGPATGAVAARIAAARAAAGPSAPEVPAEGNVVYRITPEGFVSEVFRAPVTIYAMTEKDGVLTLATGSDGRVYEVDLRRDEWGQIARVDGKDVTALLPLADGTLAVGTSNGLGAGVLSAGPAREGVYTSPVLDANSVARFGMLRLDGTLPDGASLKVQTRSGNVADPDAANADLGWSAWSDAVPATRFVRIGSPAGRYLQYRLSFSPAASGASPVVRAIEASYGMPNAAPKVTSVTVADASDDAHAPKGPGKKISWEAEDPAGDELHYKLEYRASGAGDDWRPLKLDVTDASFEWDTREVPDGRYQVRVVASDERSNPGPSARSAARVSAPFLVDNTSPTLSEVATTLEGTSATLKLTVTDAAGVVASVAYRVNADDRWHPAAPDDGLFDSPSEKITATLRNLAKGRNVVTLKATDDRGNERFTTTVIDIP